MVDTLKKFCHDQSIKLGIIQGLGAADKITIGLFNTKVKSYQSQEFVGDFELASLYGNITVLNGQIYLHLHLNFGDEKYNSFSGHLNQALISSTFEGIIEVINGEVNREYDETVGLNLLKLKGGSNA